MIMKFRGVNFKEKRLEEFQVILFVKLENRSLKIPQMLKINFPESETILLPNQ